MRLGLSDFIILILQGTQRPGGARRDDRDHGREGILPDSVYELEDICVKIALELKNQYVLGYSSTNPAKDGRWRKIKLKLNPPRGLPALSVRSKTGYYARQS